MGWPSRARIQAGLKAATFLLVGLGSCAGSATGPGDPKAPVLEAYRIEKEHLSAMDHPQAPPRSDALETAKPPWSAPHRYRLFSKRLSALWELDERYTTLTHEIGNFDADPLLDAQDYSDDVLRDLVVDVVKREGDRAEVRARFTNFGPRDIRFDVVVEHQQWVIDDVRTSVWSLRKALAELHYCAEGWTGRCRK